MPTPAPTGRRLVLTWVRVSWLGWLLGVPIIAVLALIGEAVGIGGAQVIVGAGMGAGVGLMQSRIIRRELDRSGPWILSSVVGLAIPFLVSDVLDIMDWTLPYTLFLAVAGGGVIVGVWQSALLRARFERTGLWIVASAAGWALAAGASSAADALIRFQSLRGIWGAVAYLVLVTTGGALLGLVTGPCLAWMPRRPRM